MNYTLEIIGFNINSCITAQAAGADRIELCASPAEGGVTPPYSQIRQARKILQIPFYVMIRPRGGDFLYSDEEFEMMLSDISICKKLGADGVVIGMLKSDGSIDVDRCSKLVDAAYPLGATFHRAFDRVKDYKQSLKDVISLGCERILTSGLHPKCDSGLDIIRELVSLADNDIIIMPGSGVRAANIRHVIEETGVTELHSAASMMFPSGMKFLNKNMKESLEYVAADGDEIKKMLEEINGIKRS